MTGQSCPLCGATWDPQGACRSGCPMSSGCSLVRCPYCGWEAPDTEKSAVVQLFRRMFGKGRTEESQRDAGA